MRKLLAVLLFSLIPLVAQTPDEKAALGVAQKLFDGMAARDPAMIRSVLLPDARLYAVQDSGAASAGIAGTDFATQIAANKSDLLERFTGRPDVLIHGRIAQVWGEYEFLRDGKFGHCGVDSFSLLKTAEGWKIATIVYSTEVAGCKGH
jgi:putative lumazine-binding protein